MSVSTEVVRSVIQQFADAVSARNFTALANLGAPGANYFVAGFQEKIPLAGDAPYTGRVEQMQPIFGGMDTFTFKVLGITVEGETGVLEGEPIGEGPDGKSYRNNGLIKMVVKDGKIQSEVRNLNQALRRGRYQLSKASSHPAKKLWPIPQKTFAVASSNPWASSQLAIATMSKPWARHYADRMPPIFEMLASLDFSILATVVEGDTGVAEYEICGVRKEDPTRIYENTAMLRGGV
ncbi:hypothetical protein NLJ89_g10621 [Agrocybe chaxingu]|uniref:SnoaL-like domain-containing protein n=1 Tax=Agrocybe chaxingu TaxID=84603 RepID=A0A9W8JXS8_9AGAR|nr:hypothetical protein NLJ89_g10621 [Agrocybe chaxingu]